MTSRQVLLILLLLCGFTAVNAQLVINEFSQGNSGTREYFELVVVGTKTCTDSTADIRGWVFDDHNGWYGPGPGIATGHMRFTNNAIWQNVPYGSIILLYNQGDKNTSITQADDPTDANNDHVYIIPVSSASTVIEAYATLPVTPSSPSFTYPTTGYSSSSNNWNYLGLANTGDGVIVANPANPGVAAHSVIFFPGSGTPYQTPNVQLSNVAAGKNAYLTTAAYNSAASWAIGNAGVNETPGAPNGGANTTWINGMLAPAAPITPTIVNASICNGSSYTFAGVPRTTANTYTNTFTTAGGCDSFVTLNLTVNPSPSITSVGSTQPTCGGNNGTITLNGLVSTITYNVSYSLNSSPVSGGTITANGSGQVIIPNLSAGNYTNITVAAAGCTSAPAGPVMLNVSSNPAQPVASSNSPVCEGALLNLSTPLVSGATYSWTGPNSFASASAAPAINNVTIAAGGTYSVTITVGGCTSIPGTTAVVINPRPATPLPSGNTPVCVGDTIHLNATLLTAGATYNWTGPNAFAATGTPQNFTASAGSGGYYRISATLNGCTSFLDSVNIVVNPRPAVGTTSFANPTTCAGTNGSITLNGLTPNGVYTVNYLKNGNPVTAGTTASTAGAIVISGLNAGTYSSIIVTAAGCGSLPVGPIILTNPPTPSAPVPTTNSPICEGATLSLFANGVAGAAYQWTGPNAFSSTSATPSILSATVAASGIYTITQTLNGCTSLPGTVSITVNPVPSTPVVTSNSPVCSSDTLKLISSSTTTGITYSWTGPNGFNAAVQNPIIINPAPAASGTYILTVSKAGCTSLPASVNVLINQTPAAPTIINNSPVCSGSTITLQATPVVSIPTTYSWTGPASFTSTSATISIPGATAANAGTYTVTIMQNGCTSPQVSSVVVVNPTPAISSAVGINPVLCGGNGSILLSGLAANTAYLISYSRNGVPATATLSSSVGGIITINGLTAATYTAITAKLGNCTSSAAGPVILSDPGSPTPPTAGSNSPICEGAVLNLTASTIIGATYSWNGPGGYSSAIQNPSRAPALPAMSGYYRVTATVAGCTSAADSVNVLVKPLPSMPLASLNSPVCTGDTIRLNATNLTTGATYSWSGPNAYTASGVAQNIFAVAAAAGNYILTASLNGCSASAAAIAVVVNPRPVITGNALTNPTTCGGTNGSIILQGLTPNALYTVTFIRNGVPIVVNVVASSVGSLGFAALPAGTYSFPSITLSGGSCSAPPVGPLVLSDPAAPAPPVASYNGPVCEGNTLLLMASGIIGAAYQWTGPNAYSSTVQNPAPISNINPSFGGIYFVTQTVNGCTSAAGTVAVVITPRPATPTAGSNSPVCTADTIKLTASAVTGASYSWSGPLSFTSTLQNPVIPNPGINNSGTYTVITTVGNCASLPGSVAVIVKQTPGMPVLSSSSPFCEGSSIVINAIPPTGLPLGTVITWTGPSGFTSTNIVNVNIPNATLANAGIYTTVYTSQGCASIPASINITVLPTPVIASAVGTNPTGCGTATGSILLSGLTANASYLITYIRNGVPATLTLITNAAGNISITGLTAGTYTGITAKLGNCTSLPAGPVSLSDPSSPTPPTPGNNGPLCSGATLNLTASIISGATYLWTGPNGFTSNQQNPSIPNVTVAATGNYLVSIMLGTCTSAPAATAVIVNQSPATPMASANSPVCIGNTLNLTAVSTTGAIYNWSGPNSFTSTLQNPSVNNVTAAASGFYTVIAQLGTCTSLPGSVTVSVVPLPLAPGVTTPLVYCQDALALPLTAAGTGLQYYTSATGGTGIATIIPVTTVAGTFNYYVSQSANGCEGPRALIVVTVAPKPASPVATTLYTYCQFGVASPLTATGAGLQWYTTLTGNSPLAAAPTPSTQASGTFNYYVSSKTGNCESDRLKITVIVLPKPAPPGVISPTHLCQYDSVELKADGQNLLWYLNPTGGGGITRLVPLTRNDDTTFYYVTQTVNGCESDRIRLQVIVDYKPNGIITASRPWLCAEDTISFFYFGNAKPGAVYNWKSPSPASHFVSGGGQGPYVVQYDSAGSQYIQLTINNNGCLSDVISLPVEVRPLPRLAFVVKPEGCVDEAINIALSAVSAGIDSFKWDFDNGTVVYNAATGGPFGVKWNTTGNKVITVTASTAECGSKAYRDTILIRPNPDARISRANSGNLCTGDSVELSVVNEPGTTYLWAPYQYFTDRARMASTVFATPNAPGNVAVRVMSSAGCVSSDSIYLAMKPCCEVFFPNAFSPNGDGRNDVFRPVTIGHHDIATFRIINRWGQVVYESKEERQGWDGSFNGRKQDAGTFYYYFKFRCSNSGDYMEQKGEFILAQ